METKSNITILRNLLDEDARKFVGAEILLKKHLQGWVKAASSLKLKGVLQRYLDFVQRHSEKLEGFFEEEKINFIRVSDRVMQAFVEEAEEKLANCTDAVVKDACLLACVQSINHYKISTYGTAAAFANTMEMENAEYLFHELEMNEKDIDNSLSLLAEHDINSKAIAPLVLNS